jgi:hypothetical protein
LLLVHFLQYGEIASSLLTEVRKKSGLNTTQILICFHLSEIQNGVRVSRPLTPTQISMLICCPATRVVAQKEKLLYAKLITLKKQFPKLTGDQFVDQRSHMYCLTSAGLKKIEQILKDMVRAEKLLLAIVPIKTEDVLKRHGKDMLAASQKKALMNASSLRDALKWRQISYLRNSKILGGVVLAPQ